VNKLPLKAKTYSQQIRLAVQIIFFALILATAINHTLSEAGIAIPLIGAASVHSLCPFGGVVTIYTLLTTGRFVQKIHQSAIVLLGIVGLSSILVGNAFCGWFCPLGSIQEWIGKLGRKLFKKRYNNVVPAKVDRVLRLFKYIVLIWIVYVTAVTAKLVFADYDPYHALFNFWSGEVVWQAFVVLGLTLAGSLIIELPWCRYACPLGAMLGLTNKISIFRIKRNASTCISCSKCDKACPMKIQFSNKTAVRSLECNSCLKCTSENACPIPNTVDMR